MKPLIFTLSLLALTGCTITRQAQVSEASPISGIVRLTYNQPLFFTHGQMTMYLTGPQHANASRWAMPMPFRLVSR
ncbi:lipoprotein [Salmonella enterica subsp. enterica serovar Enteritidis str. 50-5646]|nr:lipoprotein [Salmonella enterica subsp. enterica serovar Enteritidis str. 50-5646]ESG56763.1 putative lipoprotein [Salmonella enterica subsp. enterica serovar Muenchen str. baa1594]